MTESLLKWLNISTYLGVLLVDWKYLDQEQENMYTINKLCIYSI